jgi:hypothetical protein
MPADVCYLQSPGKTQEEHEKMIKEIKDAPGALREPAYA